MSNNMDGLCRDIADSKVSEIDYFINNRIQQLNAMMRLIEPTKDIEENLNLIRMFSHVENTFESLGIIDDQGFKSVTTGAFFSVFDRDYYQEALNYGGMTYVSNPVLSKDNNDKIIVILSKISENDNHMEYLTGAISINYLQTVLNESNVFDFYTTLIDDQENIIMQAGEKADDSRHVIKMPLQSVDGWMLQMEIPDEFYYQQIIYINIIIVILFIFTGILIVLLIRKILERSLRPVNELVNSMDKVTLDNLPQITVNNENKEMNVLSSSYNKMLQKIEYLLSNLENSRKQLKDAEYKALIQQIKPHFLYNTLEMIQSMCLDLDCDEKVENAIGLVAGYFRTSLSFDQEYISLNQELKHIENYINIQKIRYQDQFDYHISCKADLDASYLRFTLQPIVENAIYHGVKKLGRHSLVDIKAYQDKHDIIVEISNEATDIDADKLERLNILFQNEGKSSEYPGYGLYNINQRLKLHFGSNYALNIGFEDNIVTVVCKQPYRKDKNENFDCR